MEATEIQKQRAVAQHSLQAGTFAAAYRDLEANAYRSCFAYSRKRLDGWLQRFLPPPTVGLRLLDVGCGTGHHMMRLRQQGFAVAGVDGSREMLERARANNPGAEIHHADVERLPLPSASFDVVLCIEVLRYLPQWSNCLQEMARVLKPGGVCLATATPLFNLNGYWLVNRLARLLPISKLVRLKQFFTTSWWSHEAFARAGFAEIEIHGMYFGPLNWVERLAPGLLPRFLRAWERMDEVLADRSLMREFSNMFLIRAVRGHSSAKQD